MRGEIEERTQIQAVLRQTRGNVVQAARLLGLSRGRCAIACAAMGLQSPSGERPSLPRATCPRRRVLATPWSRPSSGAPHRTTPLGAQAGGGAGHRAHVSHGDGGAEVAAYEPWTAASRWEQALVAEKVQGFGGVVLQRSPSLLLVAFGITSDAGAAAAARRAGGPGAPASGGRGRWTKALSGAATGVHWGEVLVDVQASDPTAQLRALGETLAWPVRLLGQASRGRLSLAGDGTAGRGVVRGAAARGPAPRRGSRGRSGCPRWWGTDPQGPAGSGRGGATQSVRRPGSGARDAARAVPAGGGGPRAGGGRDGRSRHRASHACATSSSVAPWRSRG